MKSKKQPQEKMIFKFSSPVYLKLCEMAVKNDIMVYPMLRKIIKKQVDVFTDLNVNPEDIKTKHDRIQKIVIEIPSEHKRYVEALAKRDGISMKEYVRKLIENYED